jgi:hypothetical protein
VTATEDMTYALAATLRDPPPCGHAGDLWLSDDRHQRATACRLCIGCQLFDLCADVATELHVNFGVWHGHDYSPRHGGPR